MATKALNDQKLAELLKMLEEIAALYGDDPKIQDLLIKMQAIAGILATVSPGGSLTSLLGMGAQIAALFGLGDPRISLVIDIMSRFGFEGLIGGLFGDDGPDPEDLAIIGRLEAMADKMAEMDPDKL